MPIDPATYGTQTVTGTYWLKAPTTYKLDPNAFNAVGTYTLLKCAAVDLQGYADVQSLINARLILDDSLLTTKKVSPLTPHGLAGSDGTWIYVFVDIVTR